MGNCMRPIKQQDEENHHQKQQQQYLKQESNKGNGGGGVATAAGGAGGKVVRLRIVMTQQELDQILMNSKKGSKLTTADLNQVLNAAMNSKAHRNSVSSNSVGGDTRRRKIAKFVRAMEREDSFHHKSWSPNLESIQEDQ